MLKPAHLSIADNHDTREANFTQGKDQYALDSNDVYPAPAKPLEVARQLITDLFTQDGHHTLKWWRKRWWIFTGTCWRMVNEELEVRGRIWERLEQVTYTTTNEGAKPWLPTTSKVNSLMEPLQIELLLDEDTEAPVWLDDCPHEPGQYVAMTNGLLNLTTGELHAHTPAYFTIWGLDFDYDPTATAPRWNQFLEEVFSHDPQAADLLQEWMGYLISGATNRHKALLVIGKPRAGKGTITRLFHQLVGHGNSSATNLRQLGKDHGLEPLIGKPLAVIEDARDNQTTGNGAAVETLLNIIGEDTMLINPKNKPMWSGKLPARFVIMSNVLPRFVDPAAAIATRFVGFTLEKSFLGKEDRNLDSKLNAEISGIFLWALEGLRRLTENDEFTVPSTQKELLENLEETAAPTRAFLEECYTITGNREDCVTRSDVYKRCQKWRQDNGHGQITAVTLQNQINALGLPGVKATNTWVGGKKNRYIFGIVPNKSDFESWNMFHTRLERTRFTA